MDEEEFEYGTTFAQGEQYEREGKYGLGGTTIAGAGELQKRHALLLEDEKFRDKSIQEQFRFILQKGTESEQTTIYNNKSINAIDAAVTNLLNFPLFETMNPSATVWSYRFAQDQTDEDFDDIVKIFDGTTKTKNQFIDVVRYFRYIQSLNIDQEIDFNSDPNVAVELELETKKDEEKKVVGIKAAQKCKDKKLESTEDTSKSKTKNVTILYDSKTFKFPIYLNDTEESIVQRFANTKLNIPKSLVRWEFTGKVEEKIETLLIPRVNNSDIKVSLIEKSKSLTIFETENPTFNIITPFEIATKAQISLTAAIKDKDEISKNMKIKKILDETIAEFQTKFNLKDTFLMICIVGIDFLKNDSDTVFETIQSFKDQKLFKTIYDRVFKYQTALTFKNYYNIFSSQLSSEKSQNKRMVKIFPILDSLPESTFEVSEILEEKYNIKGEFYLTPRIDTVEIFNSINSSIDIPYANVGTFHKILNNLVCHEDADAPENNWVKDRTTEELTIYVRISNNIDIDYINGSGLFKLKDEDYAKVVMKPVKEENQNSTFYINIFANNAVEKTLLLSRIFDNLKINPIDAKLEKHFGSGIFVMKDLPVGRNVLFDLAMNDPVARQMIVIDERYSIHKRSGKINIYLKRNELIKNYLSTKIVAKYKDIKKTSPEIIYFPSIAQADKSILIFKVTGEKNIKDIEFLRTMFLRLIQRSIEKYSEHFVNWYCKYISNIKEVPECQAVPTKQKTVAIEKDFQKNRSVNPELYEKGYSRQCQAYPVAIEFDESSKKHKKLIDDGKATIFPKDEDADQSRPQFLHECRTSTSPYIGLKKNKTLANKNIFPYIPCCYETAQANLDPIKVYQKKGVNLQNLASKVELQKPKMAFVVPSEKTIKIKSLALDEGTYGLLTEDIQSFIAAADMEFFNGKVNYYRYGVEISGHSIIDALRFATDKNVDYKELHRLVDMNALSQSLLTITEGLEILDYSEQYLNGLRWIDILEKYFNVNIIFWMYDLNDPITKNQSIFMNRDEINLNGKLVFPFYQRQLYRQKYYDKTCIVFLTKGGEFSDLDFPKAELICRYTPNKSENNLIFTFDTKSDLVQTCFEALAQLGSVSMKRKLNVNENSVEQQFSDSVGKIRKLIVKHENQHYTVHCDPAFPLLNFKLNSKVEPINQKCNRSTAENILKFIFNVNSEDIKVVTRQEKIIALSGLSGDVKVYILVDNGKLDRSDKVDHSQNFVIPTDLDNKSSFFTKYNKFKRETNVILAYTLYLFSDTYKMINELTGLYDKIDEFKRNHTKVDTNAQYNITSRSFILENNNQGFIEGNKIVYLSEKMREKVLYFLGQQALYFPSKVIEFKNLKYVPNFYISSKDFKEGEKFTVYNNIIDYELSRNKASKLKNNYTVYSTFNKYSTTAYFFSNQQFFGGFTFLAKNMSGQDINSVIEYQKQRGVDSNYIELIMFQSNDEIKSEYFILSEGKIYKSDKFEGYIGQHLIGLNSILDITSNTITNEYVSLMR